MLREEINEKRPLKSGVSENSTSSVDFVIKDERIASEHARIILHITLGNKIYRSILFYHLNLFKCSKFGSKENGDSIHIGYLKILYHFLKTNFFSSQKG